MLGGNDRGRLALDYHHRQRWRQRRRWRYHNAGRRCGSEVDRDGAATWSCSLVRLVVLNFKVDRLSMAPTTQTSTC
jgi:hypothetical protein